MDQSRDARQRRADSRKLSQKRSGSGAVPVDALWRDVLGLVDFESQLPAVVWRRQFVMNAVDFIQNVRRRLRMVPVLPTRTLVSWIDVSEGAPVLVSVLLAKSSKPVDAAKPLTAVLAFAQVYTATGRIVDSHRRLSSNQVTRITKILGFDPKAGPQKVYSGQLTIMSWVVADTELAKLDKRFPSEPGAQRTELWTRELKAGWYRTPEKPLLGASQAAHARPRMSKKALRKLKDRKLKEFRSRQRG